MSFLSKSWPWLLASSALLVGLGLGLHLTPLATDAESVPITVLGEARSCDPLRAPCRVGDAQQYISLQILATPEPLKIFPVQVLANTAEDVQAVYADLDMLSMTMAPNTIALSPEGEHWKAEAILPICTSGRNDWRMVINLETSTAIYQGQFFFTVEG